MIEAKGVLWNRLNNKSCTVGVHQTKKKKWINYYLGVYFKEKM